MSKELAQTVRSKKVAALVAILALFTVFATLGNQWRSADAAVPTATGTLSHSTVNLNPGGTNVYTFSAAFTPSGSVAAAVAAAAIVIDFDDNLVGGTAGGGGLVAVVAGNCTDSGATNVFTCASTAVNWTSGSLTFSFTNPAGGTIGAPTVSTCIVDGGGGGGTCNVTATSYNIAGVTPTNGPTVPVGMDTTVSFSIPVGLTYCSDVTAGADARTFVQGTDLVAGAGTTVVSATADGSNSGTTVENLTVVLRRATPGTASVQVRTHLNTSNVTSDCTTSAAASASVVTGELRHVDGTSVIAAQEVPSDVRGHRHTACVIDDATGNGVVIPLTLPLTQINVSGGGGYQYVTDPDPTFADVQVTHTTVIGASAATCFSWVSTEAGDQEISVNYTGDDGGSYLVDWDTDDDGNGGASPSNDSLVKEWNVLEESCVTLSGGATGSGCDATSSSTDPTVEVTVGALFNPANSTYVISPITISDAFWGSHVNRTGGWENWALWGVEWAAWLETTCGTLNTGNPTSGSPITGTTGQSGSISLVVASDASCLLNDRIVVTITGNEPGVLGSGNGNEVVQHVVINLSTVVQVKQVFLAWAGQRVIVEHDWRLPPGDVDGGTDPSVAPVDGSQCPFYALDGQTPYPVDFTVRYIRQANSPGNFVAGLGATIDGNDEATVDVDNDNSQTDGEDIIGDANGSCISRVLYESEDQGQVNIEAFVTSIDVGEGELPDPLNQTKIAFVIYYMKLESVTVSLVDDVSKPSHNSSASGYRDYSPGNPWDSSKDVDTVDWNVSKDLLVRARVKGWFTTQNATGRAAGTDTNGGVLPAGRWVMPDDWAQLAGGTPDAAGLNEANDNIGLAEAYQPQKDIMIAPNNKLGRSLANPEGTLADVAVTTVAVAVTSSATSVTVASASAIPVNACILIDSEYMKVTSKAGNVLTVTRYTSPALNCAGTTTSKAAHAVGALVILVNLTGVPFEGPYSLLDIPGLAASGLGGAALSNWDSNNIRDTIWGDGDVDAWDAPMPPSLLTVNIRGAGFIKEVVKDEVYYIGTANTASQVYPNPFYIVNIPDSPFIPAVVAGGGYLWDSWGNDGPGCVGGRGCNTTPTVNGDGVYRFWWPVKIGSNIWGVGDSSVTSAQAAELAAIRTAYSDPTIARDLVVYTDNHGEAMVTANGDFKLDYSGCAANALAGGHHCAPGDKVGASTLTAVADYPDFRGKHYPLLSNVATVNWTWGGYKDVTIEDGETEQYKYVVFHAMDRDGFCYAAPAGSVQLHPVYTPHTNDEFNGNPSETVDFMIDSGEGIILTTSDGASSSSQYTKQFAEGVWTYSTYANDPAVTGLKEFPLSSLAATGATDECQAWIKVSNSLLGILDILVIAHDDEGDVGFDKIIDLQSTMSYSLSFRWTLITWAGQDGIATADALKGSGGATNDITSSVTAVYGWDAAAQAWLGYFPSAVPVPGANDLTKLNEGDAYWIAITGPGSVTWTIATHVD